LQNNKKNEKTLKKRTIKMTQQEQKAAVHLEQAMLENARTDNTENRLKVYQELLFSDLLLALSDSQPEDAEKTKPDENGNANALNIAILSNPQGLKFAAIFTGPETIRRWRPQGGQYATMRGQDIFKLLEPSPAEVIVVNPGSAPLAVLEKSEFRQLAAGIVPKSTKSPVQTPAANPDTTNDSNTDSNNKDKQTGVQISFPPNVFNEEQKARTTKILHENEKISAAAIGAILPPNSPNTDNWVRTIFLRTDNLESNQDVLKDFCHGVRDEIKKDNDLFVDSQFEVGVMPDEKFWESLHKNNVILFDKHSPSTDKIDEIAN